MVDLRVHSDADIGAECWKAYAMRAAAAGRRPAVVWLADRDGLGLDTDVAPVRGGVSETATALSSCTQ
jgi:AAA+ superfamily predicted ATPase